MATNLGSLGEAFVDIRANLSTLDKDLKRISSRISKSMVSSGRRIRGVGTQLTTGLLLPLGLVGGIAVRQFGQFDNAMTESLAIMGDVSNGLRREMADAAREMAKVTTFSAKEAAESYFFLASAGLDAEAAIKSIPAVARFAQAGNFDMALATDLLTDAQSALGKTIRTDAIANMKEMVRVSDTLVKANTLANATVQQFSESLTNRAGAAMRQLNIDIEEGVAVLAAWADQGLKGQIAGEQFNIVTRDLQRAARDNEEQFRSMNVEVFNAEGNLRNLADIIADLERLLGGMSIKQQGLTLSILGFQERSVQAIRSLLGFSGAIREYEKQLRSAGGITQEVADKQLESFNKKMGLMLARLNDVAISLGQIMAPVVLQFARFMEDTVIPAIERAIATFRGMDAETASVVGKLALLAIAFGPVLIVVGLLGQALGFIVGGIGFFIGGIGTIIRALIAFSGVVRKAMAAATTAVFRFFASGALPIVAWVAALAAVLGAVIVFKETLVGFFRGLVLAIRDAFVGGFNNLVMIPFQKAINKMSDILRNTGMIALARVGMKMRVDVNDVMEPTFAEDMKAVWQEAGENASLEMDKFKETAGAGVDYVKDKFKDLGKTLLGFIPELDFGGAVEEGLEPLEEIVVTVKKRFSEFAPVIDRVKLDMEELGEAISYSMEDNLMAATRGFQSFGDAAKNILMEIIAMLARVMVVKPLVSGILGAFGMAATGMAGGGPVAAGVPVEVGERGREIFVPNVSGQIIPNDRIRLGKAGGEGGGGDVNQEFNFPLVFPTQLEAFVRNVAGPAGRDAATQILRAREGRF